MKVLGNNTFYHGDNLAVMRGFADESIDTIITDPPYALEFMGKSWDKVLPPIETWRECLRVAKPGAILLAFGGTRTFHRLTCNIEDAGWEIKDCIMWVYSQGFPKSLNVSVAIDKAAGAEREVVGTAKGKGGENINRHTRSGNDSMEARGLGAYGAGIKQTTVDIPITIPATTEAQAWEGYGTALKPAWEPIIMAMKPLEGTYAQNALKHGVAGLNIDGGRIEVDPSVDDMLREVKRNPRQSKTWKEGSGFRNESNAKVGVSAKGRWPANLILSYPKDEYELRDDVTPDQLRKFAEWIDENT